MSSTKFGRFCLEKGVLTVPEVNVAGIITTTRFIKISYSKKPVEIMTHADFSDLHNNIFILKGKVKTSLYLPFIKECKPDLILAIGWYYMIPKKVREMAKYGAAGVHNSLLPRYRGGAPLTWAIMNGETRTGVSFFRFEEGVDTGDIFGQRELFIDRDDTIKTVYEKAENVSVKMLRDTLPKIANGTIEIKKQDHSLATEFPQRKPEDGEIDWNWGSRRIYNFVRAQTRPYPGAFTYLNGNRVKIWKARWGIYYDYVGAGKMVSSDSKDLLVGTGDSIMRISEVQEEGFPPETGREFFFRHNLPEKFDNG